MYQQRVRTVRTWAASLVMAGIVGFMSPAGAQPQSAPPAYTVGVSALIDAQSRTDVIITVKPVSPSTPTPTAAKQILLQAYSADGVKLLWTKSYANVPLIQGAAKFVFTNLARFQLLKAQVVISLPGGKTQLITAQGRVLYRPDLAVLGPGAPLQAAVGQPVTVAATVYERRGDVGASCDVVLLDAANAVLDTAAGVVVGAGGAVTAVLTPQFASPGTYTLAVEVRNSNPTEFDAANDLNNRATVMVVVTATVPTQYSTVYEDRHTFDGSLVNEWNFARTILRATFDSGADGESEAFSYSAFFNNPIPSAGFTVAIQGDGRNLIGTAFGHGPPHATKFTDFGGGDTITSISYSYFLNLDETEMLRFDSTFGTGVYRDRTFSSLTVQHFASDFVYFSYNTYLQTGDIVPTGHDSSGTFWRLRSNVHTDIRVVAADGTQYGGRSDTGVAAFPDEQYGPVTDVRAEEAFDYYSESTREVHLSGWRGQSSGETY